ncbi:hypothetical protein H8S23_04415 [Anaerofilum sp. BX8]|uniref:D-ribose pyranase n=1 Tax=Anaerofilum hominis TaxID=2763016 RepID=A0A923I5L1_9FIRM|nr:RbsD/FucU domain-containing protein [Anaerofilum hominis]MBC5580741.1 hypothetical protein [Anaerofilum hominis]
MLKGIPLVLSPDLLKTLAEMGHGDRIVLGDAYFASAAMAEKNRLLRADGVSSLALVDAILQLMPLDTWVDSCVFALGEAQGGGFAPAPMTLKYQEVIQKYEPQAAQNITLMDRFAFYDIARGSFAVVATGETEPYGCIILQKGVR